MIIYSMAEIKGNDRPLAYIRLTANNRKDACIQARKIAEILGYEAYVVH
jgi:hypothetical protein